MLLAAGFPEGKWNVQVRLPQPLGSTTPDVTFDLPDDDQLKVFIYLDGLSKHFHGNAETQARDGQIRAELRAQGHTVIPITRVDLDDQQAMLRHFRRLARMLVGGDAVQRVATDAPAWFAKRDEASVSRPVEVAAPEPAPVLPFGWVEPSEPDKFKTCVPVYNLRAAAGAFSEGQVPECLGWAAIQTRRRLVDTMFVAQVRGKSMEPKVPDGAWCLFNTDVAGSRYGRDLVVQHRDLSDPEAGGAYTLKRYARPPQDVPDGTERKGVVPLNPQNPDHEPITIENDLDDVCVIGELLEVLG
jgi:hypothetical protein